MITQKEYNVAKQDTRELFYRINLLNHEFQIVDELSGVATSMSFSINADSNIRRTGSITLNPNDTEAFKVKANSKIWLDKYVQAYVGIKDIHNEEVVYSNMGLYMVNNPSHDYSASNDIITLSLIDLMSKLTGERNGSLDGYTHQIKAGTSIKDAMIAILAECGFTNYVINIEDNDYHTVVKDISVEGTNSFYKLLEELNYVNTNYQMYFDVDGIFHYEKIPDGHNEQVMVNDDLFKETFISYKMDNKYDTIKNHIIVLGKTHDISNYCLGGFIDDTIITLTDSTTTTVPTYILSCANATTIYNNIRIGFTAPTHSTGDYQFLNLNASGAYPILNAKQQFDKGINEDGTYYVLQLVELDSNINLTINNKTYSTNKYWWFMGEVSPRGEAMETNPESPYYINGSMGDVKIVLSGGDYDNIFTSDLARERAEWELYTRCRVQDNIQLNCIPIYWLDVNWVIEITLPNETEPERFITKSISTNCDVGSTQTITAMRYYSFYQ